MRVYELSDTGVTRRTLDGGLFGALAVAQDAQDRGNTVVDALGRDLAPLPTPKYDERGI